MEGYGDGNYKFNILPKWNDIRSHLSAPHKSLPEFTKLVKTLSKRKTHFEDSLEHFFTQFPATRQSFFAEDGTLQCILKIALLFPSLFPDDQIPILQRGKSVKREITRKQAACIIALGFLGMLRVDSDPNLPKMDFIKLFYSSYQPQEHAKLLCILNYFDRIKKGIPEGNLVITRRVIQGSLFPDFSMSDSPLSNVVVDPTGFIEDSAGSIQVDFANKYLGGGVLVGGCVQEEIRFAISTELISCCLFCEVMEDNEALIIEGSERFSEVEGYAFHLKFKGDYKDTQKDAILCAIDATDFRGVGKTKQYLRVGFEREIKKAFVGFSGIQEHPDCKIATGNWGCGAFLGDLPHKVLVQYIAASQAKRDIVYYSFNNPLTPDIKKIIPKLKEKNYKVKDLWGILVAYEKSKLYLQDVSIFNFMEMNYINKL
eukprot:TRINITY_DN11340_c0_g1_i1.p1 TRINITY_DN11340_c0_g1~~TRINITY_DN11340_c0_g1_i1.p1  ORF type:complete len:457 (-),score=77.34 TRINITY_DN11340_c0_g1_i1:13-1296(-)